jgi:predicted Zn finger-like uncharacterized protein
MPIVVGCPSCNGKLRVADDLIGRMVRCPTCNTTFDTSAPAPSPEPAPLSPEPEPAWKDLPLQLSLDEPSAPRPQPPAAKDGLFGAIELKLSLDDDPAPVPTPSPPEPPPTLPQPPNLEPPLPLLEEPADDRYRCPTCGNPLPYDATRCSHCGERFGEVRERSPRPWRRRDAEPHRGGLILGLGIGSLMLLAFCGPVGMALGITAWVLGQGDLRKIAAKQMDPVGYGSTQAGWVCGIIGTALNTLWTLGCVGLIGLAIHNDRPSTRPPFSPPTMRSQPQPKIKVMPWKEQKPGGMK